MPSALGIASTGSPCASSGSQDHQVVKEVDGRSKQDFLEFLSLSAFEEPCPANGCVSRESQRMSGRMDSIPNDISNVSIAVGGILNLDKYDPQAPQVLSAPRAKPSSLWQNLKNGFQNVISYNAEKYLTLPLTKMIS